MSEYWTAYKPSLAAAIITTSIFAILTIIHVTKLYKTRTWFCIPLVIGGILEVIGFAARGIGNKNMNILMPYLIQALFILLAPIFFAASVYMILNRLIQAVDGEKYSIIRATWVTKVFVGGDVLCFLVQMTGGGILASAKTSKNRSLGENIILAGLILQIVIFGFFLVVASTFHKRVHVKPTTKSLAMSNFGRFMKMLYIVSVLITFRNLFRVIEYGMGEEGYLLANEWPLYAFDAVPMVLVLVICATWYIGKSFLPEDDTTIELGHQEVGRHGRRQRRHRK